MLGPPAQATDGNPPDPKKPHGVNHARRDLRWYRGEHAALSDPTGDVVAVPVDFTATSRALIRSSNVVTT